MTWRCLFLMGLTLLCTVFLHPVHAVPICSVYDGNTVLTCDGYKISLEGIRAPGLQERYGADSRQFLAQEVQNKDVQLQCGGSLQVFDTARFPSTSRLTGACYTRQFLTITDGINKRNYVNFIDCQQLYAQVQAYQCVVKAGPVDVQRRMVSQGWARNTGAYAVEEDLARKLRLGIWR